MQWLETKYIMLLSARLDRFTRAGPNLYKFRCPLCGDSELKKSKTRGYIFLKGDKHRFHCHNCGESALFRNFLKQLDSGLYYQFVKETITEQKPTPAQEFERKMAPPKFVVSSALKKLKKISSLPLSHPAKMYVDSRKIPSPLHYKLFYCKDFNAWVNSIIPDKMEEDFHEERLVIPFLDEEENLFGFQGRALDPEAEIRYITILLDEEKPRVYGMEGINRNYDVLVFEGPIDAMMLPNSIASAGGDISQELSKTDYCKEKIVVIYDNEPRNKHTVSKIDRSIKDGYRVCIWPASMQWKDVNDMIVKGGMTPESVSKIVKENTFSGLEAKLHLTVWKR